MPQSNSLKIEAVQKEIRSRIENAFSQKLMKSIGEEMAERIRVRTRTGKGVDAMGGNPTQLKRLADSYRQQRSGMVKFFKSKYGHTYPVKPDRRNRFQSPINAEKTTPTKSNLTFTGQLLDAIYGGAVSARKFFIAIKDGRNDGKQNSDIVKWQDEKGRSFFYFSGAEIKAIYNKINTFLRKELQL